jgi:hypothetical protein
MTDRVSPHARPGDLAVPLATGVVAATAAAAVAWAAATPARPAVVVPAADSSAAVADAQRQLTQLRQSLADVRRDLTKLAATRLTVATKGLAAQSGAATTARGSTGLTSVRVPAAAPAPAPAPPATHTTTGASGAPR